MIRRAFLASLLAPFMPMMKAADDDPILHWIVVCVTQKEVQETIATVSKAGCKWSVSPAYRMWIIDVEATAPTFHRLNT